MKRYFFAIIILLAISFVIISFLKKSGGKAGPGFAVVELFTSEGCSSCPPADEVVADLARQNEKNVFILGYHVDYWNYLGWKDVYSNSVFSNRQKQYASTLNLTSVYTPQIVVNGKTELVGSDKNKLQQTIAKELSSEMIKPFDISAKSADGKNVSVNLKTDYNSNEMINVALVQLQAQSDVKHGENNGKQLHHINIVRDFKTIDASAKQQSVNFILPAGFTSKDFTIIAFSQNKNNLQIDNAAEITIQ
jgi:hypothetical protein